MFRMTHCGLHKRYRFLAYDAAGGLRKGRVEADEIGLLEYALQGGQLYAQEAGVFLGDKGVVAQDAHVKAHSPVSYLRPNLAKAYDSQRPVAYLNAG